MLIAGYRFIFVWSGLVWPGPGGPVPVATATGWFWWPGGPVPVPVPAPVCFDGGGPVPVPVPVPVPAGPGGPVPVARVPVPIKRITYAVWPASMSPGMDAQSLPGIWLFYAVLQTTGERQTILRSRDHYRTKTGAKRLPKPTA